ncbi:hypothetical protein WISP_03818 [Willisornis vidua]|uniref:Uncharacterized protein n=1 Tax=Willisornis vidua TaxID=1566151 RepID=A0ABQ9DU73_9PASS|nr:hypothetical protein WISP_03818 [Willisornis vidua]
MLRDSQVEKNLAEKYLTVQVDSKLNRSQQYALPQGRLLLFMEVSTSVYAPTLQADPAEKEKFYYDLHHLTQRVPADDKITVLGKFNAKIGVTSIEAMLMRMQPRWAGHVSRMEDHHLPKIVLYGELVTDFHKRGAPKKRYKDSLKHYLSSGHIDCHEWSTLASSWDSWRHTIHNAVASFENTRRVSLNEKRQRRKNRASPISPRRRSTVPFLTGLAYPASAFLATSTLAASVGSALPKSSFTKPSHDDE